MQKEQQVHRKLDSFLTINDSNLCMGRHVMSLSGDWDGKKLHGDHEYVSARKKRWRSEEEKEPWKKYPDIPTHNKYSY